MGRELRRVPANWQHPRDHRGHFRPLHDRSFSVAAAEWDDAASKWSEGLKRDWSANVDAEGYHGDRRAWKPRDGKEACATYEEWGGERPTPEFYMPDFTEPATWFQVYETVSEGTPVTPAFATPDDLIEHLCLSGTQTSDGRPWDPPWSRRAAESFVRGSGWAPSLTATGGVIEPGYEGIAKV